MANDDPTDAAPPPTPPDAAQDRWARLQQLPSQQEAPLHWDHRAGGFVESAPPARPASPAPPMGPPVRPARARSAPVFADQDPTMVMARPTMVAGAVPPAPARAPHPAPHQAAHQAPPVVPGHAPVQRGYPPAAPPPPVVRPPAARPAAPPPVPPARIAPARPRRRRRWGRWVALLVIALPLLLVVGGLAFAWQKFEQIERVEVADVLSPASGPGTNYLIVGTDSREGIDPDDPNAGAFLGDTTTGSRTDTIMVLRVEGDRQQLLSVPRDLWVANPVTGEMGRINSVYASGPAALVQAVQGLGIPVHRYLEIDFVSFAGLVDAVGGVTIEFPNPAKDDMSGLYVEQTGPVRLDGEQSLAYVRSRTYTELIDGQWQTDPTADLGRTERQRAFLSALFAEIGGVRNPVELADVADSLSVGVRIDDGLDFFDALGLAWDLRNFAPESVALPVYGRTTSGGAAVLELQQPDADAVLAQFG